MPAKIERPRFVIAVFSERNIPLLKRGAIPEEYWDKDAKTIHGMILAIAEGERLTPTVQTRPDAHNHYWIILSSYGHSEFEQYWKAARDLLDTESEWSTAWMKAYNLFPPKESFLMRKAKAEKTNTRPDILTVIAETLDD